MKLIVNELQSTYIEQDVTPASIINVVAIRPHLYVHNNPTGTLQLKVYQNDGTTLVASSEILNISSISTSPYFHGYVRFYINAYLAAGLNYKIRLYGASGYSFSESAYCGWCNGYDLGKYTSVPTPTNSFSYSLDLEIWNKREL